jgi:hypothetical protein
MQSNSFTARNSSNAFSTRAQPMRHVNFGPFRNNNNRPQWQPSRGPASHDHIHCAPARGNFVNILRNKNRNLERDLMDARLCAERLQAQVSTYIVKETKEKLQARFVTQKCHDAAADPRTQDTPRLDNLITIAESDMFTPAKTDTSSSSSASSSMPDLIDITSSTSSSSCSTPTTPDIPGKLQYPPLSEASDVAGGVDDMDISSTRSSSPIEIQAPGPKPVAGIIAIVPAKGSEAKDDNRKLICAPTAKALPAPIVTPSTPAPTLPNPPRFSFPPSSDFVAREPKDTMRDIVNGQVARAASRAYPTGGEHAYCDTIVEAGYVTEPGFFHIDNMARQYGEINAQSNLLEDIELSLKEGSKEVTDRVLKVLTQDHEVQLLFEHMVVRAQFYRHGLEVGAPRRDSPQVNGLNKRVCAILDNPAFNFLVLLATPKPSNREKYTYLYTKQEERIARARRTGECLF